VVLVTKSCDIGAYSTGKTLGRHKLISWLSPGKTWEGLIGGMVTAGLVTGAIVAVTRVLTSPETVVGAGERSFMHLAAALSLSMAVVAGALLGGVGQVGDLLMSLFKRDAQVKDAGSILPGFGGVLDVLDSPLLAAPLAYWMLLAVA